jgi:hypothetical protein
VTDGLILLGFIAALVALLVARVRRRIGKRTTAGLFVAMMAAFAITALIFWVTSRRS